MKGVEILQIALASSREKRDGMMLIGVLSIAACVIAAFSSVHWQDSQAESLQRSTPSIPSFPSYP